MESGAIARFEGITARGDEYDGPGWYFTDLDGWTESPGVDLDVINRAGAHGIYALPAYMRERRLRIPGFHVAPDHRKLEAASQQLRSLQARQIWVSIEDVNGSRRVQGTVTEAAFRNHGFAPEGTWELAVTCPLPWKYGKVRDFPAGVPAVTKGTVAATPRLLVGAGAGGYTITGPSGRIITVTTAPAAAHVIDLAEGGLFLNGARQIGAISVLQPWDVEPGPVGVAATISGARTLTQRLTDTDL